MPQRSGGLPRFLRADLSGEIQSLRQPDHSRFNGSTIAAPRSQILSNDTFNVGVIFSQLPPPSSNPRSRLAPRESPRLRVNPCLRVTRWSLLGCRCHSLRLSLPFATSGTKTGTKRQRRGGAGEKRVAEAREESSDRQQQWQRRSQRTAAGARARGGGRRRGGKRVGAGRGAAQILLNPHNCDNGALFVISGATL